MILLNAIDFGDQKWQIFSIGEPNKHKIASKGHSTVNISQTSSAKPAYQGTRLRKNIIPYWGSVPISQLGGSETALQASVEAEKWRGDRAL